MKRVIFYVSIFLLSFEMTYGQGNRILLIGDSITDGVGSGDSLGFRDELYTFLTNASYPFQFVGPEPPNGDGLLNGHFYPGATIKQFYNGPGGTGEHDVGPSMNNPEYAPHIVVIHLGTNDTNDPGIPMIPYRDTFGNLLGSTASGRLAHLLAYLADWHDGTKEMFLQTVFLCKIIPNLGHMERCETFNAEIDSLYLDAEAGLVPGVPPGFIRVVDQYSTFDTDNMFDAGESIHPNDDGYVHIAEVFFEEFRKLPMNLLDLNNVYSSLPHNDLPHPFLFRIIDGFGNGFQGIPIHFQVINGDGVIAGSLSDTTTITDESGYVSFPVNVGSSDSTVIELESSGLFNDLQTIVLRTRDYFIADGIVNYYANGSTVPDVYILLNDETLLDVTDSNGYFSVDSLQTGESLSLIPEKEQENREDLYILSYDAALIARHVVGIDTLTLEQRVAADVDGDGQVSMTDAIRIARYIVDIDTASVCNPGDWVFDPPFLTSESVPSDLIDNNFTGYLLGDVHGGWRAFSSSVLEKSMKGWSLQFGSISFAGEDTVVMPVMMNGDRILSCDVEVNFDSEYLHLARIEAGEKAATAGFRVFLNSEKNGNVRIGMFSPGEISGSELRLFSLIFTVSEKWQISMIQMQNIYLNDCHLKSEVTTGISPSLRPTLNSIKLGNCYPNPFNSEIRIPFYLDNEMKTTIRIYNVLGREVITLLDRVYPPGEQIISWNGCSKWGVSVSSGLYVVELSAGGIRDVQKFKLIR